MLYFKMIFIEFIISENLIILMFNNRVNCLFVKLFININLISIDLFFAISEVIKDLAKTN